MDGVKFCSGSRKVMYDPMHSKEIWSFPDDYFTISNPDSPTGRILDMSPERAPWVNELGALFQSAMSDMSTRSGFSRLGGVTLRFTGPVSNGPSTPEESLTSTDIQWFDMSQSPPERVAFKTITSEFQNQLVLKPVKPLPPNAEQAIVVTNDLLDVDGNCVAPADLMADLIQGNSPTGFEFKESQIQRTIETLDLDPENISHLVTYTTHDDLQVLNQISADIQEADFTWNDDLSCTTDGFQFCERTFTSQDYRDDVSIQTTAPKTEWDIPTKIWLPENNQGPIPIVVYGHGLNSRAHEANRLAERLTEYNMGVVAIDALHHGVHPSAVEGDSLPALKFLGLNLESFTFDAPSLRGSFDQSAADRMQLIELLKQQGDLNDDGIMDVDAENILYYGVSLGGLMGPQILANTDVGAGVLFVAGGDLPIFSTDTGTIAGLDTLLGELIGPPDVFQRMIPLMQTSVDASDPAVWATHILSNRFDDNAPPDILFPVCLTDDTVPPATAKALAHGLGVPHLAPVLDEVPMLDVVTGPLQGNLANGATGAYFQFDRITSGDSVVQSTHHNLNHSPEGSLMADHFLLTHLDGQTEIINPYELLETPLLE